MLEFIKFLKIYLLQNASEAFIIVISYNLITGTLLSDNLRLTISKQL